MTSALLVSGIKKSFGSNQVLHDVGFMLSAGEVTVLMGANGAGKSTLVKILSGVHQSDAGQIELFGETFNPVSPKDAMANGVLTVHQSINEGVVPDLDIASNLLLDQLASGSTGFWLGQHTLTQRALEIANLVGLNSPMNTPVRSLSLADRQLVAIARAMARKPRLLILDEPTSSLSATEAQRLFALIDKLRKQRVAILYITHRMSDIKRLADRIVTMRDGRISGEFVDEPLDVPAAITAMLGRVMDNAQVAVTNTERPALILKDMVLKPGAQAFDLTIFEGEIIAVTGLVGSGKSTLANVLFGLEPPVSGTMQLNDKPYKPANAANAIEAGVYLCPRDRASNAIIPDFDLTQNITLPFTSRYGQLSWINQRKEMNRAAALIGDMGVVCQSPQDNIGTLSGGNQQKVVVARWMAESSSTLILDEPFQGVDIQARRDISKQLRKTAGKRATIVLVSELDEALEIADRIVVMVEHTLIGEHINHDIDMDQLLAEVASAAL